MKVMPVEFLLFFSLATMSPFGWHHPHLKDNKDTQYLVDHNWQQCWCFRFSFFFESICLSMCQSVCVSVHLFRINLKFFKTHNYWLAQLLHLSLVSEIELKTCRMYTKMHKNSSKKSWVRHYCQSLGQNNLFSNLRSYCCYDYYLVLAATNEQFRVTPSTSSAQYRYSVSGGPALTTVFLF